MGGIGCGRNMMGDCVGGGFPESVGRIPGRNKCGGSTANK